MALRPRESPNSMPRDSGSQALADGLRWAAAGGGGPGRSIRARVGGHLIGRFCARVGGHLVGRFCRCTPSPSARWPHRDASGSQICRRRSRGGRSWAFSMRRSDHPSRPNAMTCCFFSSFKTLLTSTEGSCPRVRLNVLGDGLSLAGFQVIIYGRFWVITEAMASFFTIGPTDNSEMTNSGMSRRSPVIRNPLNWPAGLPLSRLIKLKTTCQTRASVEDMTSIGIAPPTTAGTITRP